MLPVITQAVGQVTRTTSPRLPRRTDRGSADGPREPSQGHPSHIARLYQIAERRRPVSWNRLLGGGALCPPTRSNPSSVDLLQPPGRVRPWRRDEAGSPTRDSLLRAD